MSARIVPAEDDGIAEAIDCLRRGGLVAFPTDTVYGIATALEAPGGIERLFHVKGRPAGKGIVLLLADAAQAPTVGVMTPAATALGNALWPGGLTVIVPQRADRSLPAALTGGTAAIGLRVPDHATPRALAAALGPLPTTSANRSGENESRDAIEVGARIGDDIDLILDDGPARGGVASTVVDCTTDAAIVLRRGAISAATIAQILDATGIAHDIAAD